MSRGLGKLQRALLRFIEEAGEVCTTRECAEFLRWGYTGLPIRQGLITVSERTSTNRALHKLAEADLVAKLPYNTFNYRKGAQWATPAVAERAIEEWRLEKEAQRRRAAEYRKTHPGYYYR